MIAPAGGLPSINIAALNLRGLEDRTWDVEWTSVLFKPTTLGYRIAVGTPFDTGPGLIFPSNTTLTHRFKGNRSSLFQLRDGPGPATNTSIQIRLTTFFQDTLTVFEMGSLDPTFQLKILGASDPLPALPPAESISETFTCNDGCQIPEVYVNDSFCDCPQECEDEAFWTCEQCIVDAEELGMGLGVATVAFAVGLGGGLPPVAGAGAAAGGGAAAGAAAGGAAGGAGGAAGGASGGASGGAGGGAGGAGGTAGGGSGGSGSAGAAGAASTAAAAFVSSGDLTIEAPQQVMESGQFTSAVQRAIARLAGANVAAAAVELIIGCLAGRRLIVSRTIDVCFEIQSDNRDVSEEICRRLSYVQRQDVQRVIASELLGSSISPDEVRVVYYRANRNPQAPTNPNAGPIANPYQPGGGAINLG